MAVATVFVVLVLVAFGLLHHVAGGELEYIAMDPAPNIKKNEHKPNSQDSYSQIPSCFASAHQHPYALTKQTKQLSLTSTLFHREINPPKSCKNGKKRNQNSQKLNLRVITMT